MNHASLCETFCWETEADICMFPDVSCILLHVCLVSLPDVQHIQSSMHQVFLNCDPPFHFNPAFSTSVVLFLLVFFFFFFRFHTKPLSVDPTNKMNHQNKKPEGSTV